MQPIQKQSVAPGGAFEANYPTQADINRAIRRAHRLRAYATAAILRKIGAALRRAAAPVLGGRRADDSEAEASINALAALRSSAEILRDNPDLDHAQRGRLVDIVLSEEAKLEAMVAKLFRGERASGQA